MASHTAQRPRTAGSSSFVAHRASPLADLLYDGVFSGALGGSAIALFFLAVDLLHQRPLFTPSLIGTVLFTDMPATAVTEVRLDMVAYFSAVPRRLRWHVRRRVPRGPAPLLRQRRVGAQ